MIMIPIPVAHFAMTATHKRLVLSVILLLQKMPTAQTPQVHVQNQPLFKAIQQTATLQTNLILNQNTNQNINQTTRKNNISH